MTDPDLELIRRAWDAISRRDSTALRAELHEDIVIVPFGAAVDGSSYSGVDSVIHWLEDDVVSSWESYEAFADQVVERSGDRLLVTGRWRARGRGSGIELDRPGTWIMQVRDGKLAYWQTYTDPEQATRDLVKRGE